MGFEADQFATGCLRREDGRAFFLRQVLRPPTAEKQSDGATMQSSFLDHALLLLQQHAYARVLCEFHRMEESRCRAVDVTTHGMVKAQVRLAVCERRLAAYRDQLTDPDKAAAVRVARALYLRFLLSSAATRLQPWCDGEDLSHMPRSHMFEWIAHDYEQLELAALEDAMTPAETALYARSLEGVDD